MKRIGTETRAQDDARKFSKAFGWVAPLGHLLPPYHDRPPVPPGHSALPDAWKEIFVHAGKWRVPLDWRDVRLRTAVAERVGQAAAAGEIVVPGADARTGDLYLLPRESWLTTVIVGGRVSSPAHFAFRGGLVRLPPPHADVLCRPFVSFHDLAVVMGALDPPPRPGPGVLATVPLDFSKRRRDGASAYDEATTNDSSEPVGAGDGDDAVGAPDLRDRRRGPDVADAPSDGDAREPVEAGDDADAALHSDDRRGEPTFASAPSGPVAPDPIGSVPPANTDQHSGRPEQATTGHPSDGSFSTCGNAVEVEPDHWDADERYPASTGAERDAAPAGTLTYRTGAPGHPTSKQLVEDQMRRRARNGIMCGSLTKEADVLAAWLLKAHPLAARMMSKSIRNQLCDVYRELNSARNRCPK